MKISFISAVKVCLFCCVVFLLSACAGSSSGVDTGAGKTVKKLSCLIVLPTQTPVNTDSKMTSKEAENLRQGAAFMDGVIADELKSFPGSRLLSAAQVEGLLNGVVTNQMEMIKRIGKALQCDAILTSTITRFRERQGGEYAVDSPASAAFTMELIRVDDGKVLWRGNYEETQESLLSNLLSFGKALSRGFKWITVEQMVREGVHERLSNCPYLK